MRSAREHIQRGDADLALGALRPALLESPSPELYALTADALRRRAEDRDLAELFDRAADAPEDVERAFELGSRLLSNEDADLAAVVLSAAMVLAPFDAVLRSETAIALARAGRPAEVVQTLALHPNLADDPGALFEFAWASLLVGDVETARASRSQLASLSSGPRLLGKLDAALGRAEVPPAATPPDARDFYFLEHGALLVDAGGPIGGRYETMTVDAERAGHVVAHTAVALKLLWPRPRRVVPASDADASLAAAIAEAIDGELTAGGSGRTPAGLLVMRDAGALETIDPRTYRASDVLTFALSLGWSDGLVHAPDFVGLMARKTEWVDGPIASRPAGDAAALLAFVEARRRHLPPSGRHVHTAYLPDAPLPTR